METEQKEKIRQEISDLKKRASSAYSGISRNYKQKLIYNLLAATKSKDSNMFLRLMFQNINGIMKTEEQRDFAKNIKENYEKIQGANFEKYAYAVVSGILASKDPEKRRKGKMEVDSNE